jgi:glycosyltransferase A (GT-A) superfamily protein (DUF2064 family)
MKPAPRRCVLLFTRPPSVEARRKGLAAAEPLFLRIRHDVQIAAANAGADLVLAPQRGSSFGERLRNALRDVREMGYDAIVVVPGDVPGLGARQLDDAFAALRRSRVVLGPSPDGGVYLIGCRGPADPLIEGVRWNTAQVLEDLRRRAPGAVLLASLADLDRPVDLATLAGSDSLPEELRDLIRSILRPRPTGWRDPASPRSSLRIRPADPRGPPSPSPAA